MFTKTGSAAAIATEAASLAWLAEAEGGAKVAELVEVKRTSLSTRMLAHGSPSRDDAREFGRRLAHTHAAGADWWGQAPPSLDPSQAKLAELPAPMAAQETWTSWGEFYAEARLVPYFHAATLDASAASIVGTAIERIGQGDFDHPQPQLVTGVARIHGDLWSGNVLWPEGVGTLIDPCAHGGHAETDLAELGVFGAPHLADIVVGYNEESPLADGWQERVALHQFHMLLVHVALFGGSYVGETVSIARSLIR